MKNLKDYFKLIFTAVIGLLMSFVSAKGRMGDVAAQGNVTGNDRNGKRVHGVKSSLGTAYKVIQKAVKEPLFGSMKLSYKIIYGMIKQRTSHLNYHAAMKDRQVYADTG